MSGDAHDRTTSHAKTVDLDYQQNGLDRARALKEQFNITKAAQQALEQEKIRQGESASHAAPARTASHAKTVEVDHHQNALDRALSLKEQFGRAKSGQQAFEQERMAAKTNEGSRMVQSDAPRHDMRPPASMRNGPDRASYEGRLNQEMNREDEKLLRAMAANQEHRNRLNQQKNLQKGRGMDSLDRSR